MYQTTKMPMSLCLKGLRKWNKMWRKNLTGLFSIEGRKLTDAEVRKVVDYGIEKGYETDQDIPVQEIIILLGWDKEESV